MPPEQPMEREGSSGTSSLLQPSFPPRNVGLGPPWSQPIGPEQHFLQELPQSLMKAKCLQCLWSCARSSSLSASGHGRGVSQGFPSCEHGGWPSLGGPHITCLRVVRGREGSHLLAASSVLTTGEGETGTFSSSPLKFFMFSSVLQMDSTKQMPTGWEAQAVMQWSQRTPPCSPFGLGFITGQKSQNPPHRGSVVPGPCLACPWSSVWCSLATGGREVSQELLTKEGFFPEVCRFAQEFLILAVVDQAVYLMGACRALLTGC